jgi:hypothetical protein
MDDERLMENVTFSDSKETTELVLNTEGAIILPENLPSSFEEYCKRYPGSEECREYDT